MEIVPLVILALSSLKPDKLLVWGRPSESSYKVHNVILYPERHAWCEGKPIHQVIGHEDCEPKVIGNSVCVGQCFTYSVPRTIPVNPEDNMLHYCDSCRPAEVTWKQVKLQCNNKEVPELTILVEHVENCACQSCLANEYKQDFQNTSFPKDVDVAGILNQADKFKLSKLQFSQKEQASSELIPRQTVDGNITSERLRDYSLKDSAGIKDSIIGDEKNSDHSERLHFYSLISHKDGGKDVSPQPEGTSGYTSSPLVTTSLRPKRRFRIPLH